jgi:hypothetical protein
VIGASAGGHCNRLLFDNGTYTITGKSTGIGTGDSAPSASLQHLVIRDGDFNVQSTSTLSSGIGTGHVGEPNETSFIHVIQIDNGTFYVRGGKFGAGIGLGHISGGGLLNRIDSIIVKDGSFDTSGECGSGIGMGRCLTGNASIGSILIVNTRYFASYPLYAASIGTGDAFKGHAEVGSIEILNGTYNLKSHSAAAIGTGRTYDSESSASCDTIAIHDGNFTIACDRYGTGIGAGLVYGNRPQHVGSITIDGGTFSMLVDYGAGIGSGTASVSTSGVDTPSAVDSVAIHGGHFEIVAASGAAGAGIGCGYSPLSPSTLGLLEITNGTFVMDMTASTGATAIGAAVSTWETRLSNLSITGGVFDIRVPSSGAGIGAGRSAVGHPHASSRVDSMTVRNARVSVLAGGYGTCFGAPRSTGHPDDSEQWTSSEVGEMVFENAELS